MGTPRIAIVTGANRGLGRSTALALAGQGVDSIITYRSHADEARSVVAELTDLGRTAAAVRLDTGELGAFDEFVGTVRTQLRERWDRDTIDILVNNAGTMVNAPFVETTVAQFDQMVDVHLRGVFFLTQALVPVLADGGRVITVSTGLTRFTGPGFAAYGSVKGAVEVLTRYLAAELGPRGITVNAIAPGPIATDFGGGLMRDNEEARRAWAGQAALGRIGEPDDIGGALAALLSDGAGWITGQRIEASGGTRL